MSSPATQRLWELGSGPQLDSPDWRQRWGWRELTGKGHNQPQVMLLQMVTGGGS